MKKLQILTIFVLFFSVLQAQKFTVSGYVKDAQTGESAIGANVYIEELMHHVEQ